MTNTTPQPTESGPRHTVDQIAAVLLAILTLLANCFLGFVFFLFLALSGLGCDSGSCDDSGAGIGVIGFLLVIVSCAVTIGGLRTSIRDAVHAPMFAGPLLGAALTAGTILTLTYSLS